MKITPKKFSCQQILAAQNLADNCLSDKMSYLKMLKINIWTLIQQNKF